jgi:hypothetical protein
MYHKTIVVSILALMIDGVVKHRIAVFGLTKPQRMFLTFKDCWVAVFLAFQSQCWHSDNETGHCTVEVDHATANQSATSHSWGIVQKKGFSEQG